MDRPLRTRLDPPAAAPRPGASSTPLGDRLCADRLLRRDLVGGLFVAVAGAAGLSGCATGPSPAADAAAPLPTPTPTPAPTGREGPTPVQAQAPAQRPETQRAMQQFSLDLGALQDTAVNGYVGRVGQALQAQMPALPPRTPPYSYRALNAHHLNAYAFSSGALGITRGLLIELADEAELAALLGQQLGHVNARHAAADPGAAWASPGAPSGASPGTQPGPIGASALIPAYSAAQVAEADALGLRYMVGAGYPASAMLAMQARLAESRQNRPGLLAAMVEAQPMGAERREAARRTIEALHAGSRNNPTGRERFMDGTASLRRLRPLIEACKNGELALARKSLNEAHGHFKSALEMLPQDYAANLRMAQCLQAMGQVREALAHAVAARDAYPQEAQAHKLAATLALAQRDPAAAWQDLDAYDRLLSGDPEVVFLKGVALEALGQIKRAAEHYRAYLGYTEQGQAARYAAARLRLLGYER